MNKDYINLLEEKETDMLANYINGIKKETEKDKIFLEVLERIVKLNDVDSLVKLLNNHEIKVYFIFNIRHVYSSILKILLNNKNKLNYFDVILNIVHEYHNINLFINFAIENNDIELFEHIMKKIDDKEKIIQDALIYAKSRKKESIIEYILDNYTIKLDNYLYFELLEINNVNIAEKIINNNCIDKINIQYLGNNVLTFLTQKRANNVFRYLIDNYINEFSKEEIQKVLIKASYIENYDVVEYLLDKNVNLSDLEVDIGKHLVFNQCTNKDYIKKLLAKGLQIKHNTILNYISRILENEFKNYIIKDYTFNNFEISDIIDLCKRKEIDRINLIMENSKVIHNTIFKNKEILDVIIQNDLLDKLIFKDKKIEKENVDEFDLF